MDEQRTAEIVRGLHDGRPDAWQALHDAYAPRVWQGVARLLGQASADVADVVQETMLAAARSARSYDPVKGSLWVWLWGIARNQVLLHYRRRERQDRWKHCDILAEWSNRAEPPPLELLESAELQALVRAALIELDGPYETLLTAKYLEGDSVGQIASREKTTETAVRSKLARAREAFRQVFVKLTNPTPQVAEVNYELP